MKSRKDKIIDLLGPPPKVKFEFEITDDDVTMGILELDSMDSVLKEY